MSISHFHLLGETCDQLNSSRAESQEPHTERLMWESERERENNLLDGCYLNSILRCWHSRDDYLAADTVDEHDDTVTQTLAVWPAEIQE